MEDNEVPADQELLEASELNEVSGGIDEDEEESTEPGREPVILEPENQEAAEQEGNNPKAKDDHHQKPTEHGCVECGKKFREKRRLVDHVTDVHTERKLCPLCPETFSNTRNFNRHMNQIHRTQGANHLCCNCGKEMSRKQMLKTHEERCIGNQVGKSKQEPIFSCKYCDMKFTTKYGAKRHEQKKHVMETPGGYMLINNTAEDSTPPMHDSDAVDFICKVCPIPFKLSNKKTFEKHSKRMHNGRNDQIRVGKFTRNLSEEEIQSQSLKTAKCSICDEELSCKQYMEAHMEETHNSSGSFRCRICDKGFSKKSSLNIHVKRKHLTTPRMCPDCGKTSGEHMKIYQKSRSKKALSSLKRSQLFVRSKEEVESIKKVLFEAPDNVQKSMWNGLLKDCPFYMNKIKENPLTEEEVIDLIKENNLSDRQLLNICHFLRQKWGKEAITSNIKKKLGERKGILDQFFTQTRLSKDTKLNFKTKKGNIMSRSVTYCHELPGLIAFKKLVEDLDDDEDVMNVIGVDDGKNILKIVWNWSLRYKTDKGKMKLMGPKRSIILAVVAKVKETHQNMAVLMELTKLNEVEYLMSMDLKLINITIGICSHSSR